LATVITNLLSAIPWLGKSLVEFVWGGLCMLGITEEPNKNIKINVFIIIILLFAGISCKIINFIEYVFTCYIKYVKMSINVRQSAEILIYKYLTLLRINIFHRNISNMSISNKNLSNISISQRLESGNFIYPYLVGLIEGDGWFSVSKKGKYIIYELGIELSIRDVQLVYKIKELLGVGTILFRYKERVKKENFKNINILSKQDKNMVIYRIRNKSHLIENIIPIFDKYPFLTNKQYDYIRFRTLLLSNVIYSDELNNYIKPNIPINTIESIINVSYFPAWLVGFIEAESSFCIYKPLSSSSYIASFEISQTNGEVILLAIKKYLRLIPNVIVGKTNNYSIKVSSIRGIENIIKFMSKAPLKLMGYKKLQYIIWLKKLKQIPRYNNKINIPSKY